ncbi:putative 60s ribosomal subunit assembly export protein loc1 protein [Lasiodiplodia theobromae]|uniref:60S ribosomal subunit assembly/export protein loc1 n=2 Tax=Lasiodiplodia TaxID=66739 RepID=A0A5N5DNC3_9PEZI|nr:60S ribosomal subunit assembly/export protein loc1 [Lasiodiplodia theobromae]KAB2579313.1 60S ribosomal subunit assembly/export protein loc1 [Lasiodiplodia theobromae]KAF4537270.1 60S ribosomal subunit assembly/export protein loc1 [Lasiodiplodia theobromae]KAF9639766.1 putative 60s ribosomal subunit assembly export protein loc1 protein [Lasiodiplodia theobromae]KAK0661890.1 60S ribosomal subunit assembly/export protein loc1 [Lasiodiplodia hormozganensis]
MAPVKPQKSKSGSTSSSAKGAKPSKHSKSKTHTSIGTAKVDPKKKKKRTYTEEELGIPKLNMITPVGVQKPKGKKKGKVFVDDQEGMMTILAMVNAEQEGQIESKMMKARQMEEIREARKKEAEARLDKKREKFEETKDSLRKKHKPKAGSAPEKNEEAKSTKSTRPNKKRVSFG